MGFEGVGVFSDARVVIYSNFIKIELLYRLTLRGFEDRKELKSIKIMIIHKNEPCDGAASRGSYFDLSFTL